MSASMRSSASNARGPAGRDEPRPHAARAFPPATVRLAAVAWLAIWVPAYWRFWGPQNFVLFCDMAALLTCAGLLTGSALLLSSQAVASIVPDALWCLDVLWRLLLGHHLFGGTEYMWDAHYPIWLRMLSLFHLVLPFVLLYALRRTGYDGRGWLVQIPIAAALTVSGRFFAPEFNINFAFRDPLLHRAWHPPALHIAILLVPLAALIYFPTHLALKKYLSTDRPSRPRPMARHCRAVFQL